MSDLHELPKPDLESFRRSTPERKTLREKNRPKPITVPNQNEEPNMGNMQPVRVLLGIFKELQQPMDKLYRFCNHYFNTELADLAIDRIQSYITCFEVLKEQIEAQNMIDTQLSQQQTPSPVRFSVPVLTSQDEDEWPDLADTEWIEVAASMVRPPRALESPVRETMTLEEKQSRAEQQRMLIENKRSRDIRRQTNKVRKVLEERSIKREKTVTELQEKQVEAEKRREELLRRSAEKASQETRKAEKLKTLHEQNYEDQKKQIEEKRDIVLQRHDEIIRERIQRAQSRSIAKATTPKKRTKTKATIVNEYLQRKILPGSLLIEKTADDSFDIFAHFDQPNEENLTSTSTPNPQDRNMCLRLVKTAVTTNAPLIPAQEEAKAVRNLVTRLCSSCDKFLLEMLKPIQSLGSNSDSFVFVIGIELCRYFLDISKRPDSLGIIRAMLAFWDSLLHRDFDSGMHYFIRALASQKVIHSLSFSISLFLASDLNNENASSLLVSIVNLFKSLADFLMHRADFFAEPDISASVSAFVVPSFVTFLTVVSPTKSNESISRTLASVTRVLSVLTIAHPNPEILFDEHSFAQVTHILRNYFANNGPLEALHEAILLYGLLARRIPSVRESCLWLPSPRVLSLLCDMKVAYLTQKKQSVVLIPTLIALCMDNETNVQFVLDKINGLWIYTFLDQMTEQGDIFSPHLRIDFSRREELKRLFSSHN